MLSKIINTVLCKSIVKDVIIVGAKRGGKHDDVVNEKLGIASIDEFMKMDVCEYNQKRETPSL